MKAKTATWIVSVLLIAVALCIAFVDRPFAFLIHDHLSNVTSVARSCTSALEWIFAFQLSKYFYVLLLLALGLALNLWDRNWARARYCYFIGATLLLSRLGSGTLKNVFQRLRPHEFIASDRSADFFVDGGGSFPSGHAAFYFGLFLPLALIFPRWRWLFVGFAAVASLARVFELDHYLSDLLAAGAIALVLTSLLARLFGVELSTARADSNSESTVSRPANHPLSDMQSSQQ